MNILPAKNIVLLVHYFPPINSSGAKRMEAMARYFARAGRNVTVITTVKRAFDGEFTEQPPPGVKVIELDWHGRPGLSSSKTTRPQSEAPSGRSLGRRTKDLVMNWFGQLPDPRLPYAISFANPILSQPLREALVRADVIVATTPPWPPLLAALIAKKRFRKPVILDYRDQLSLCHEMPGGAFAKTLELKLDRFLCRHANALVAVSHPMGEYYGRMNSTTSVIMNGYDPEAMGRAKSAATWSPRAQGQPLVVRYLGLVSEGRIPRALLAALAEVVSSGALAEGSIRFEYYGDSMVLQQFIKQQHPSLQRFFLFRAPVSYAKSLELAVTADYLLFCENAIPPKLGRSDSAQGILTTKLFEYLASGRPILAHITTAALAGSFIAKASAHHIVADQRDKFTRLLLTDAFWHPQPVAEEPFVRKLSRTAQAAQYLDLIDAVVSGLPSASDPGVTTG